MIGESDMLVKTYNYISNWNKNIFYSSTGPRIVYQGAHLESQITHHSTFPHSKFMYSSYLFWNFDMIWLKDFTVYIQGCNSDNSWGSIIWPGGRLVPYHLHAAAIWERWMTADVEFPRCKIIIQLLGLESTAVWWSVTLHIVPSSQGQWQQVFLFLKMSY